MARAVNYEGKINQLREKIEKKQNEIKNLRTKMAELEAKQDNQDVNVLASIMREKGISAQALMDMLNQMPNTDNGQQGEYHEG
ncbi:MAG: protein kinase [Selenomonadaceae bacterium]|nr:protein kinase [Selenomonadaceae bacterium]